MIQYNWQQMGQLAEDLREQLRVLNAQHETLQTEVKSSMDSAWQSPDAKEQYDTAQQNWNNEFADTNEILNNIIRAVDQAAADMQAKDGAVGSTMAQ